MTSLAVTVNATLAPPGPVASAVIGPGTETVGAVASTSVTVTVKVAVPVFPAPSGAEVQVTVVEPTGKLEPEARSQVAESEPEIVSVADTPPYMTVPPDGTPVVALTSEGGVTTGSVVSTTVMLKLDGRDVFVDESDAVHDTEVVPSGNTPGERLHAMFGDGSTSSLALTEKETLAPSGPVASAVMSSGTPIAGGVVSAGVVVVVVVVSVVVGSVVVGVVVSVVTGSVVVGVVVVVSVVVSCSQEKFAPSNAPLAAQPVGASAKNTTQKRTRRMLRR
jgi:hypothetical protein